MCLGTRRCNALNDGQKSPPLMSKAYTCKKKHWHSEIHGGERFKLIISIVKRVIRRHKPQTLRNVKWQELFPRVIVKVDAILYSAACSLEEYKDITTLDERLDSALQECLGFNPNRENSKRPLCTEVALDVTPYDTSNVHRRRSNFDSLPPQPMCPNEFLPIPLTVDRNGTSRDLKSAIPFEESHLFGPKVLLTSAQQCPVSQPSSEPSEPRVWNLQHRLKSFCESQTQAIQVPSVQSVQHLTHGNFGQSPHTRDKSTFFDTQNSSFFAKDDLSNLRKIPNATEGCSYHTSVVTHNQLLESPLLAKHFERLSTFQRFQNEGNPDQDIFSKFKRAKKE